MVPFCDKYRWILRRNHTLTIHVATKLAGVVGVLRAGAGGGKNVVLGSAGTAVRRVERPARTKEVEEEETQEWSEDLNKCVVERQDQKAERLT